MRGKYERTDAHRRAVGRAAMTRFAQTGGPAKWDAVLNEWAAGHSSGNISYRLQIPRGSVARIVSAARRRGDARAVSRGMPEGCRAYHGMTGGAE